MDSDIQGVLVTKVDDQAESMGPSVRPGDVIMKVNQEPVSNLKEFKEAAKRLKQAVIKPLCCLSHPKAKTIL